MVPQGSGCQANLVCRYHGWAFDHDGTLLSARDFGVDLPDGPGLTPVRVQSWRGMIFVCLSPETPAFDEWFGGFAAECDEFQWDDYRFHSRSHRVMRCNWKTYGDNYLENYHVPIVHLSMAQRDVVALHSRNITGDDPRWNVQRAPTREGHLASGIYTWFWPNFAFDVFPGGIAIERYIPRSVDRTDLIFDYFFADDAEGVDEIVKASEEVAEEDVVIVEVTQRNLESGLYTGGVLSPRHENGLADFHRLVRDAIDVGGPASPVRRA